MNSRAGLHRKVSRRTLLGTGLLGLTCMPAGAQANAPLPLMAFPRDFGSHPGYQIEWWYVTGYAGATDASGPREFGF